MAKAKEKPAYLHALKCGSLQRVFILSLESIASPTLSKTTLEEVKTDNKIYQFDGKEYKVTP